MPQSELQQLAEIARTAPAQLRPVLTHYQQERVYRFRRMGLIAEALSFIVCIGSFT